MKRDIHSLSTRTTSQQQAILKYIQKTDLHLSAEEVYDQVRKSLPRISLGTVYRNLELLSQKKVISKIVLQGLSRFEATTKPHYHVVCLACGAMANVDTIPASDIEDFFGRSTPYRLTSHELILYGVCPKCNRG